MGSNSLYYARIYNINLGGKKNNMGAIEILLISIGLAMDAFAVSVCKGLAMKKMNWKKAAIIGLYFGIFQAVMPVIGYFLGNTFEIFITYVDHWVAFILLVGIGINMVKEAFNKESENRNDNVDMKTMLVLSIATSIDYFCMFENTHSNACYNNRVDNIYNFCNRCKNWKPIW